MANNILDKPAMESIMEMEKAIAIIAHKIDGVPALTKEMATVCVEMGAVKKDLDALSKRIDEEPLRCPFRDSTVLLAEMVKDVEENKDGIKQNRRDIADNAKGLAEVKTEVRIAGGLNAAFTSLVGVIAGLLGK